MAKAIKATSGFQQIVQLIMGTKKGQEASMYGPLRDLFSEILGYPKGSVLIDVAGEAGRPDITCRAPSGITDRSGKAMEVDWIVVEAKDEHDAFSTPTKRENIFAQKSKYIRPDTAWFVMVDPTVIVARPVLGDRYDSTNDIVFSFSSTADLNAFATGFARLRYEVAGVPQRLAMFRGGDTSLIGTEKLGASKDADKKTQNRVKIARRNFYETLRNTTSHLQEATLVTLQSVLESAEDISKAWEDFKDKYSDASFDPYTLTVSGKPGSYEKAATYGGDVSRLNRQLKKAGSVARLILDGYPQFKNRVSAKSEAQMAEMFATETANLILARILLIRFFEDHQFFGKDRYLCNGGVEAFQKIREKFNYGYTRLLEMAYEKAQALYAAAFDETELDWVFATNDMNLSNAIEWAMYQLSRYDFTTVKGDILTGVYDRFLDKEQRKRFGEYYTPPSIARYIVERLGLKPDDKFMDPSCGSGTFLIERYQQVVGEDADAGIASFSQVQEALQHIAGNDINTFSAVLAQIQILWHLLSFKDDLLNAAEFPDIAISDKANSIVSNDVELEKHGRFFELNRPIYGGIGGNPPYVRPERAGELDNSTRAYFASGFDRWKGISPEANLYALFTYKALDGWCQRPNKWGENAGKLGFVVPLALCGTNENSELRRLFGPNGRWTIKEIVDLEVIWRNVFDADVLPIVIIAEARPPRLPLDPEMLDTATPLPKEKDKACRVKAARMHVWMEARLEKAQAEYKIKYLHMVERNLGRWQDDEVIIKLADKSCVDFGDGTTRPSFNLHDLEEIKVQYADIFTPDGRIITRMTSKRREIIAKLQKNPMFETVLKEYWYKKSGNERGSVSLDAPNFNMINWEHREMVSRGIVFAGKKTYSSKGTGHTIYKAENILSGAIYGEPQDVDVNILTARNRYLMEFSDILPKKMWAVAMIATCPNAVSFDPKKIAFTDTATIFAPRDDLQEFPFDLFFLSRVVRYFYALAARMSYLNMYRSHVYPTNLRLLPWSNELCTVSSEIEKVRDELQEACRNNFQAESAMLERLSKMKLRQFKDVVRDRLKESGGKVEWSESLVSKSSDKIELSGFLAVEKQDDGWKITLSTYSFDWVVVPDEETARCLTIALLVKSQTSDKMIDRDGILNLMMPFDPVSRAAYEEVVVAFRSIDHAASIEAAVDKIDALLGERLGLDTSDLAHIKEELANDPFLKNIIPRWPATETRIHGYRTGLDSSERYA